MMEVHCFWKLVFCAVFFFARTTVLALAGRLSFECADGHYLSDIISNFGEDTRLYNYDCSPLSHFQLSEETCTRSEVSTTLTGEDMYMPCQDTQYLVGISVITDSVQQKWSVLCCESPAVKVRQEECTATAFLNEFRSGFSFTSERQIIRKMQALHDTGQGDKRWWLQVCPFDLQIGSDENSVELKPRFTRNTWDEFGPGRLSQAARVEFSPQFFPPALPVAFVPNSVRNFKHLELATVLPSRAPDLPWSVEKTTTFPAHPKNVYLTPKNVIRMHQVTTEEPTTTQDYETTTESDFYYYGWPEGGGKPQRGGKSQQHKKYSGGGFNFLQKATSLFDNLKDGLQLASIFFGAPGPVPEQTTPPPKTPPPVQNIAPIVEKTPTLFSADDTPRAQHQPGQFRAGSEKPRPRYEPIPFFAPESGQDRYKPVPFSQNQPQIVTTAPPPTKSPSPRRTAEGAVQNVLEYFGLCRGH